jgi:hypothetical protein
MDPVMAFSTMFKKATNLLGIGGSDLKPQLSSILINQFSFAQIKRAV